MPTIVSALLFCLLGLTASPPRLRLDVVFGGVRMLPRRQAAAMEEITRIWAVYGVDVRRADPIDAGADGALRLAVVLAERQGERVTNEALASISFFDNRPQPTIVVYPNTINAVVSSSTLLGRNASEWAPDLRETILGRVLGRAVAHEIGHFLLRSREHSDIGLMRACPPVSDFIHPNRQPFVLSVGDEKRLAWMMAASLRAESR